MAAALAIAAPAVVQRLREARLSRAGLDHPEALTADDVLQHVARLCWALGYRVFRPPGEQPELDLILTDGLGHRQGVLTRHFRAPVDEQTVELAAATAQELHLDSVMLVGLEGFTAGARTVAGRLGATLWGLPELTDAMRRVMNGAIAFPEPPAVNPVLGDEAGPASQPAWQGGADVRQEPLVPPALQNPRVAAKSRRRPVRLRPGEAWSPDNVPHCPRCGRKMVIRSGREGDYWGCPLFPRCLGTRPR